jgi:uncharacterized protein (DUF58 family)
MAPLLRRAASPPAATAAERAEAGADGPPLLDSGTIRQLERLSLVYLDAIVAGVTGQRAGPAGATGLEFADYRPYAPGDDLRRIDWNVYARLHELLVKVAPEEGHIDLEILLDASRSMDYGHPNKLRHARRLAAAIGTLALLRADAVQVFVLSDGHAEASGRLETPSMLMTLAREVDRLPAGRGTDLPASIGDYRSASRFADVAVLISDVLVPPESLSAALQELSSAARNSTLLHVVDSSEEATRLRGAVELRDRETGRRLEATVTGATSASYAEQFERFTEAVRERCAAAGVRYLRAPTDVEPLDLLVGAARESGFVRA